MGDGEEERIFEVEEMTPPGFSARRSRVRPFCFIRSAWNWNSLSVLGRLGAFSNIL